MLDCSGSGCQCAACKVCMQGVTELTIKQVGVVLGWQAVNVKDVEQVEVLAMHITTDCQLGALGDRHIHQGWKLSEYVIRLQDRRLMSQVTVTAVKQLRQCSTAWLYSSHSNAGRQAACHLQQAMPRQQLKDWTAVGRESAEAHCMPAGVMVDTHLNDDRKSVAPVYKFLVLEALQHVLHECWGHSVALLQVACSRRRVSEGVCRKMPVDNKPAQAKLPCCVRRAEHEQL